MIHTPEMNGYNLSHIQEVHISSGDGIEYLNWKMEEGYEVIFWLPWYNINNRFIGIKYFLAKKVIT